mmetsp:Transcript_10710/g.16413  ORF Transcript_10710/g.16413 Transcript_10710/m.16413 type:complete len:194 (-) Transcript_10710:456-1037(-)|eukprot:CAMPEP_0178904554 /NCGR_PEP_ID=MMETSP0786-20121207/5764_1 /TAXON_ID=186022 /ORGANISM="Thalassionema frauenfeldii, Strain CCMP 1798" /LENGTH=193 /DNA_ID=CAMNT_0020576023 /DNA_START=73 /DNA_END=654 /DNA_ORIENTATION=-
MILKVSSASSNTDKKFGEPVSIALSKYENAEEISNETGFQVPTRLGISTIPEAGLARFLCVDVKKGDIIRKQKLGGPNLDYFDSVASMEKRLNKDGLSFFEHFGHVGPQDAPETKGLLVTNFPPLYSNHCTGPNKNIETVWDGDVKYIRACRDAFAGEELMEDYRNFGKLEWFEQFLLEHNKTPVRILGEMIA